MIDLSQAAIGGTSALSDNATLQVFVRSADGEPYDYQDHGSSWPAADLSQAAEGGGRSSATRRASCSATIHVYAVSSVSGLTEYAQGPRGSGWGAYDLSADAGGGGAQGDPSALVAGSLVHVYVQSSVGHLAEYVNDGAAGRLWNAYDLSLPTPAPPPS